MQVVQTRFVDGMFEEECLLSDREEGNAKCSKAVGGARKIVEMVHSIEGLESPSRSRLVD